MAITVKELREAIKDLSDDTRIIIQSDPEGNSYHWAAGADCDGVVAIDDSWAPEIYSASWTADEADMDEEEWEELKAKPLVLVIHP